ncbi:MAG: ABC transporter permease [Acidobacteriia bacterium]|nr:ABC transporter permease [Terriglobia bacterium]
MQKYRDDLVSRGVSPQEAELRARREFGRVTAVKEEVRESSGLAWADTAARNFRYAFRVLRKNPAFSLTVIVTLALCIGANTAIFSIVDAMLFRPLPYPEPDRLARVARQDRSDRGWYEQVQVTGRTWEYIRDHARTMDVAVHSGFEGVNLVAPAGGAQYIRQVRVSTGFFRVLGVSPMIGREIAPEEDRNGGPAVAVLSHGLWTRLFASDAGILGQTILLRGEPFTVIGVMPQSFDTSPSADLWTPLRPSTRGEGGGTNYSMIVRLRPGSSMAQANAELETLGAGFIAENHFKLASMRWHLITVQRANGDSDRGPVLLLWAAVGLVLLIGCVNIAGLMLARGGSRQHEIATRMALGSGRGGILAQLLSESLLLAVVGGIGGFALGALAMDALKPVVTATLRPTQPITMDARVMIVTALTALLTGLIFGFYPALASSRGDLIQALGSSSRTASAHRNAWARRGLVVCEVALGMVLLVSAGLVLRPLLYLNGLNPGFDPRNVLTASLSLRDARYTTDSAIHRLFDTSLTKLRETPGVEAAGIGLTLPYERPLNNGMRIMDGPHAMPEVQGTDLLYVTQGYFETLRFTMQRGRKFEDQDRAEAPLVAIVNETFVRQFLKEDSPLGRHVNLGGTVHEIVGVVTDVQQQSGLGGFGPVAPSPTVYVPAAQLAGKDFVAMHNYYSPHWVVRSAGPLAEIAQAMRAAVASVDRQLPFAEFRSMDEVRSGAFARQRLQAVLLGSLAALALVLAAVGIYGLVAHSVMERTREFGIRLALGASRWQAMGQAARPGILLTLIGAGIGYFLARSAGRLLAHVLWRVQADDRTAFAGVTAILVIVAALASLLPSLRIARLDPATTLREE